MVTMDNNFLENNARKVRFTLPSQQDIFDPYRSVLSTGYRRGTIHGTRQYVNGTLTTIKSNTKDNKSTTLQSKPPKCESRLPARSASISDPISRRKSLNGSLENIKKESSVSQKRFDYVKEKILRVRSPSVSPKLKKKETIKELPQITKKYSSLENINKSINNTILTKEISVNQTIKENKKNKSIEDLSKLIKTGGNDSVKKSEKNTMGKQVLSGINNKVVRQTIISSSASLPHCSIAKSKSGNNINKSFKIIDNRLPGYDLSATTIKQQVNKDFFLPSVEITKIETLPDSSEPVINDNFLKVPEISEISDNINDGIKSDDANQKEKTPNCVQSVRNFVLNKDKNLIQFWDFVERWRNMTHSSSNSSSGNNNRKSSRRRSSSCSSVQNCIYNKTDDNKRSKVTSRLKSFKMSLDQIPVVTTLLRASRDANEFLLKEALRDVLINGISKEDLNSCDKSGRTAISYICSTNLTHFLDIFLQLPGIDVNKADNEGNTPLHFAAQAGQSDVINMLLTRSRSLVVDAKNNLGFTPLMKAALQGRTKCAKLLLFAGASPVETDPGRGLRAEQWARFCGRYSCAEMIEKCARARLLEKTTSCKWPHDSLALEKPLLSRSRTGTNQQQNNGGIRSKFRKVFPFGLSFRGDKQIKEEQTTHCKTDLVKYLSTAALCASGPVLPSNGNSKIIKSLIRPLEVPKLEVTLANNISLIKKYEDNVQKISSNGKDVGGSQAPTVPPRGKIKK